MKIYYYASFIKSKALRLKNFKLVKIILIFFSFIFFPLYIYAYIDPGTGSYIIQLAIAAFVGISFAVKIFWKKIKNFFSSIFSKKKNTD